MTDDEIHDICQQAESLANRGDHVDVAEMVKQAVRLAVEREREACANLCDRLYRKEKAHASAYGSGYWYVTAKDCASAIRARGE